MFTVDGFFYNAWFSHGLSLKLYYSCHMPYRKLIPLFILTAKKSQLIQASFYYHQVVQTDAEVIRKEVTRKKKQFVIGQVCFSQI